MILEEEWKNNKTAWQWVHVGDYLDIGDYRHKVVAIVPPMEAKDLNRENDARMVGWIELEWKPVEKPKAPDHPSKREK